MSANCKSVLVFCGLMAIAIAVYSMAVCNEAAATTTDLLNVPFFSQTALQSEHDEQGQSWLLGASSRYDRCGVSFDRECSLWEFGCGVASLAMVFRHYGVDTDVVRLNQALRDAGGFSGPNLAWLRSDAFRRVGSPWVAGIERIDTARPQDYRGRVDAELAAWHPIIVFLGNRHYVVLTGKDGNGNYLMNDPWAVDEASGKSILLEQNALRLKFENITQFIFVHPDRNAPTNGIAVSGVIGEKYFAVGGSRGSLGNPVALEEDFSLPDTGRYPKLSAKRRSEC
ncbi:MAG: hypothetical protein NT169_08600 [Chloroflexi bacterium]|nr:hypothetical protein [Chloroflexota bacterium]